MNKQIFTTTLILILPMLIACSSAPTSVLRPVQRDVSYDDVMLIINDASWASTQIGNYFAERRNIPAANICHITADTSETMDSATFVPLRWQIQEWMRGRNLVDSINYIVTTKGCPLRIATRFSPRNEDFQNLEFAGQCSFEDCLVLINGADSVHILTTKLSGRISSKYFRSSQHFRRQRTTLPMYLVTRLDAFTVDQVHQMIDRAEQPAGLYQGLWVLDVAPERDAFGGLKYLNDQLRDIADTLRNRGMNVLLNNDDIYIRDQQDVIGYASWGSNDMNGGNRTQARPRNTWLNGAIAQTYVSTSGFSFDSKISGGQSMVADIIAEGISGVIGYTDEPYSGAMALPGILFNRYTSGFNMAESYYAAMPNVAWRQVVIGDPKMQLDTTTSHIEQPIKTPEPASKIISIGPNPFGSSTRLTYIVAADDAIVQLELLDMLGQHRITIFKKHTKRGTHVEVLDLDGIASGNYLCRLTVTSADGAPMVTTRSIIHNQ